MVPAISTVYRGVLSGSTDLPRATAAIRRNGSKNPLPVIAAMVVSKSAKTSPAPMPARIPT
jgi:hypothetical protein